MANALSEYFRLRCMDTREALQNQMAIFSDLCDHTMEDQLKGLLQMQRDTVQAELDNMDRLVGGGQPSSAKRTRSRKTNGGATEESASERIVIVGRAWTGQHGRTAIENYHLYITQVPQYMVDLNAALLAEEVTHFNLGNFTGLIVLAKELGDMEAANLLQQNIDHENSMRMHMEAQLWQVVGSLHQQSEQKAA